MRSNGRKPHDLDDVEEGKIIVQALKENHRWEWEEQQGQRRRKGMRARRSDFYRPCVAAISGVNSTPVDKITKFTRSA